jgi:hypothetical protein
MDSPEQPAPVTNDGPLVKDLVILDIESLCERRQIKYGTHLQAHNGRDALQDTYEEMIDGALYLKQVMMERANLAPLLDELIRAALAVANTVTVELADDAVAVGRLKRALGAYGWAHTHTGGQLPIPDPNENYVHPKLQLTAGKLEEARRALVEDECAHCGRTDVGSLAAGWSSVSDEGGVDRPLCHPIAPDRPDCYRLVAVYHHATPCTLAICRAGGA